MRLVTGHQVGASNINPGNMRNYRQGLERDYTRGSGGPPAGAKSWIGLIDRSETDAESLASYTTFQSGSSFHPSSQSGRTIPSPRLASFSSQPYPQSHIHTHNPSYAQAAYSPPIGLHPHYPLGPSYAQNPSVYNGTTAADLSLTSTPEVSGLELRNRARAFSSSSSLRPETSTREISVTDEERRRRRARREEKRRERAEKSTLKGEMYDSPLRSAIRWGSVNDLSRWSLGIGMAVVWVIRMVVGALGEFLFL